MKEIILIAFIITLSFGASAQDQLDTLLMGDVDTPLPAENGNGGLVTESFAATRVINNHSTEMLPKLSLEFIVAHKFGDLAGSGGGYPTWFGLDNLADVRIAFEYGLFNNMNIGLGRSKGIGLTTQVVDGYFKYAILRQQTSGMPVSLTFVSALNIPYRPADADPTSAASWPTALHRFIFTNQLLVSRKFSDRVTLQINVGYNHRNYVHYTDYNGLVFAGISGRCRITKNIGILFEYDRIIDRPDAVTYTDHLGFSLELLTGGHAFALNFTNSRGVTEGLFIPGTVEDWTKGQFRFGFSINRRFKL
jgi:hypothetical protein